MTKRVWDYLVGHMPVNHPFTSADLAPLGTTSDVSAALSNLCLHHKRLEVTGKRGTFYVYQLVSLDPPKFGHTAPKKNGVRRVKPAKQHRLKQTDFSPTGRQQQPPEMHQTYPRTPMVDVDFSKIEERVMAHYAVTTEAADAMRRLGDALDLARKTILAGFTDEELLSELNRRHE